ncbi:MAG: hypothetical protein R3190_16645, partial [Thermoanaerobaculia bacterium]|nr:hypothetical protein [Thermoanaerobaculia bacterium]
MTSASPQLVAGLIAAPLSVVAAAYACLGLAARLLPGIAAPTRWSAAVGLVVWLWLWLFEGLGAA